MRPFFKKSAHFAAAFAAWIFSSGDIHGQYYYPPPGYYYPPPQYYPQQPQYYPSQQQYRQQRPASRPKASAEEASPPDADISHVQGPFISHVWDFEDSFGKLSQNAGLSQDELLALNAIAHSSLRDGQVLRLPAKPAAPDNSAEPDLSSNNYGVPSFDDDDAAAGVAGHSGIPADQFHREVWRGVRGYKRVALTFDAGAEATDAELLLANLKTDDIPATFFITGKFAEDHPELIKQIAADGHPVRNHSWSHPRFTELSGSEIAAELERTDEAISAITGKSTQPYWRPPFGDRDDRVLRAAAEAGYISIYWTIDSLDSVGDSKSAEFVTDRILNPAKGGRNPDRHLDGAIILMHVGNSGTVEAIPEIARGLRECGFRLVTVDEILRSK